MTISMHSASVPVFVRMLGNAVNWLDKAQAHADARKFDSARFFGMRLAPDMLGFERQIQIAGDNAKGCVARLAGLDAPKFEDNETTLADLRSRLSRTIDYVQSVPAAQIDGSEGREIVIPRGTAEPLRMSGEAYLKHFATPNVYFHLTTTYALLRMAGVELGKRDFLGAV